MADSILSLPIKDARAAVKIIESLRIDSILLANQNRILAERVTARDKTIGLLSDRIKSFQAITANYDKQIVNLNKQVQLATDLNTTYGKQIRKERTKTWIVGIAGVIVSGAILYLTK